MSDTEEIRLTLTQESDYAFRIAFDETTMPSLLTDEASPLGGDRGPNPTRLLAAAVANCLSASLLFALRKYRNAPGTLVTHAVARLERNGEGRLRVAHIGVAIALPEGADDYSQIERLLQQFENFCVVTESVRAGVAVDVTVTDGRGKRLHDSTGSVA